MSLLAEIRADAIDASVPISVLLRKCMVLAATLDHLPLREWVDRELNGYGKDDPVPSYRAPRATSVKGNFSGPMNFWWQGAEVPRHCIDERDRESLFSVHFTSSVAEYESLLSGDSGSGEFRVPWPTDFVALYGQQMYEDLACVGAWRVVPRNWIENVLDQIRNKVLAFALELEGEDPDAGDAPVGSAPIPKETVTQIFQTTIYGGVGAFSAGGTAAFVDTVAVGDWASLTAALAQVGLPRGEIDALEAAIAADGQEVGQETTRWQDAIREKIAQGSIRLADGATAGVISGLVLKFLGAT